MKKSAFHYDLPPALIAQQPLATRTASRLLCLDGATGAIQDRQFDQLPELLRTGDLLVFNDTRVLPARLFGAKDSGGRVELLVERLLDDRRLRVQCRASKPPKPGQRLQLDGGVSARVVGRSGEFYELVFDSGEPLTTVLERIGHMPLPPYIARADAPPDRERYQTVWARARGAVAAPTAGLHFDAALLADLDRRGVERAFVTLHVGAGTFQPLRVDEIEQHRMHSEVLHVSAATAAQVNAAKDQGRRVIAVGTTVVRALEAAAQGCANVAGGRMPGATAAQDGRLQACDGETAIFIYPGYRFRVVDALITNFHLPESTLLMLVCAFAGTDAVLRAYRHAVEQRYRFFSYGDVMFVTPAG